MSSLEIEICNSGVKGPNVLVLAAVHGNEPAGTKAIEKFLMSKIELTSGTVTFIPVCNPVAKDDNVRFLNYNLNRILEKHETPKSIEHAYANQICEAIDEADYVLDLHSTHLEGDLPTVFNDFVDEETTAWAEALNVGTVITSWREMLNKSEAPANFSDTVCYANRQGKKALLIEAGYHNEPDAEKIAYKSIINTLEFLNMVEPAEQGAELENNTAHMYQVTFKTQEGGEFVKPWKHMDEVCEGEVIATLANGEELKAKHDGYVVIPFPDAQVGEEWFYLAKK